MQTFLPYRSFQSSAKVLDDKRLGKQRVETYQIMKALTLEEGWVNHPVTKMWKGYELSLLSYQEAVCDEWSINRGFRDTCLDKTSELFEAHNGTLFRQYITGKVEPTMPPWWGKKVFHSSHRANLLRKDPVHYGRFGWKEEPAEHYWWPSVA